MKWDHWFSLLGGVGLFLFSLRFLTRILERSLSRRLRGAFSKTLASPLRCIGLGLAVTTTAQVSSITIMAAMGLVGSGMVNFEQGYFLMLGATIGTTLKAWIVGLDLMRFGPALVGLTSLLLLFARQTYWRNLLEGLMAIGFAFWGMDLLAHGLEPLRQTPEFHELLTRHAGENLYDQVVGVAVGALAALSIQSSSPVVALAIVLGGQGALAYPEAAAVILGANVGTTFGPLLASLEHSAAMRRLALAHFGIKLGGVLITLFFFPQFIEAMALLVPQGLALDNRIGYRLAMVHTGFNLINVIWWSFFAGFVYRAVAMAVPDPHDDSPALALSPVVRRILRRSDQRSLEEARRQMTLLQTCVKALLDRCGRMLEGAAGADRIDLKLSEQRNFLALKESTEELLVQSILARERLESESRLALLADLEELYMLAWRLRESLEEGRVDDRYQLFPGLRAMLPRYLRRVDESWLEILFPDKATETEASWLVVSELRQTYCEGLRVQGEVNFEAMSWNYDVVNGQCSILEKLHRVNRGAMTSAPEVSAEEEEQPGHPPHVVEAVQGTGAAPQGAVESDGAVALDAADGAAPVAQSPV